MQSDKGTRSWIKPLLMKLQLVGPEEFSPDLTTLRAQLEESGFMEQICEAVGQVNRTAGRSILQLESFLPPRRAVSKVSFYNEKTEHVMEIVLRTRGPALVFYSRKQSSAGYLRYINRYSYLRKPSIRFVQHVQPKDVTEHDIECWFSYLLSGFKGEFKPLPKGQQSGV